MSQKTEGDVFRALTAFLLTAEEPIAFLRRWNEGSFDICRKEWPEAPEDLYPPAPAAVAVLDDAAIDAAVYVQCPDFDEAHEGPSLDDLRTIVRVLLAADPAQEHAPKACADYSLKKGDKVSHSSWMLTDLFIVDVNWALRAAAIQLGSTGAIIVWPVEGLVKV